MRTFNGMAIVWGKSKAWVANAKNFHQRIMMRFLRKRGWVVFYLSPEVRECKGKMCWMRLYNDSIETGKNFIVS